jgi:hypothetical protein
MIPLPNLYNTLQSVWHEKWFNGTFILANIILIGLISYRLINSNVLSEDEKVKLSYAELILSAIGSFVVLLFGILLVFLFIFGKGRGPIHKLFLMAIQLIVMFLVLNPFSMTILRLTLDDKLTDQQKNIISGLTIPVALFTCYLTPNVNNGYFLS